MLGTVRRHWRRRCALAPISAILAQATIAAAEPPSDLRVAVRITARTSEFGAELKRDDSVVARCNTPCALDLEPGKYSIRLTDSSGNETVEPTRIVGSSHLTITPPDQTAKWTGLALGIGGTGSALVGVGLLFALTIGSLGDHYEGPSPQRPAWMVPTTVTTLVVGAIATPIGWTIFGKNRKPAIDFEPLEAGPATSFRLKRFSIVVPWATGVALSGTFDLD
jgi:hypothetical protein